MGATRERVRRASGAAALIVSGGLAVLSAHLGLPSVVVVAGTALAWTVRMLGAGAELARGGPWAGVWSAPGNGAYLAWTAAAAVLVWRALGSRPHVSQEKAGSLAAAVFIGLLLGRAAWLLGWL